MKIIAFERADGGVAITRCTYGYVFGMQAGLAPAKIVALQKRLIGLDPAQMAELEKAFVVGNTVELKVQDGKAALELAVLLTSEEVIEGHAQELLEAHHHRRFMLLEEVDLPPRDTRASWRLVGDKVVAGS